MKTEKDDEKRITVAHSKHFPGGLSDPWDVRNVMLVYATWRWVHVGCVTITMVLQNEIQSIRVYLTEGGGVDHAYSLT